MTVRRLDLDALARGVRAGDKPHVARALNLVEDSRPELARDVAGLLAALAREQPAARGQRVGFTGPPGVGKSSLVALLARTLRSRGSSVGVVAVDPSSVRSGGALLGDRARMALDPSDAGLFMRSLATQGALGGLSSSSYAAIEVLAAAYDVVLIETVGIGQSEVAVAQVAETVVLVVQPGSGDVLQFLKAGVMEIPDLLVVNKADHGKLAERAASDLTAALHSLRQVTGQATTAQHAAAPVLLTSAQDHRGIDVLADALAAHHAALGRQGVHARRTRGQLGWALEWLTRRVGTLGVEHLGGPERVAERLARAVDLGAPVLAAAQALAGELAVVHRPVDPR